MIAFACVCHYENDPHATIPIIRRFQQIQYKLLGQGVGVYGMGLFILQWAWVTVNSAFTGQ